MNDTETKRLCPFLNSECIGDACNLFIEVTQHTNTLGMMKATKAGMCVFPALAMIQSSKPQTPVPIRLPGLRGN